MVRRLRVPARHLPAKPDPALFCSTSFGASYDSRMALGFIKQNASGPVKLGFSAMSIPLSRNEVGYAATEAKKMGMGTTEQQIIPPPTADYTPFATKIKDQGANWVYSWAPWVTQIRTLDALRKLGWSGDYIAYAHINAEDELERVKDGKFYVFGANAMFRDNLPVHAELRAVAQKAKLKYPITQLTEGFISGMILEAIAAKAGAKPTRASVLAAMGKLDVDLKGLRGGPIQWTASNHFRGKQSYRVYRFDPAKGAIVRVQDWTAFDVK
ncbi:MAG: ABC transporter substrate-binding protein [Burkholderiaceae bacterium]